MGLAAAVSLKRSRVALRGASVASAATAAAAAGGYPSMSKIWQKLRSR
jgi:hypothetical protein